MSRKARGSKSPPSNRKSAPLAPPLPALPSPLMDGFRDDRAWLSIILALAFLLPIAHLTFARRMPHFYAPIIDSLEYVSNAEDMLNTNLRPQAFYQSPGYSWLVAMVFGLTHRSLLAVRLVHVPLHALTALLIYGMGRRIYGKEIGRLAGIVYVLYGPILFYNGEIFNVVLMLLLNVAGLYLITGAWQRPTGIRWALAGITLGLAVVTRADVLIFAMLVGAAVLLKGGSMSPPLRMRAKWAGAFGAAVAIPLFMVGLHNLHAGAGFAMFPTNSGMNFFQGNNPRYAETMGIRIPRWYTMSHMPLAEGVGTEMSDLGNGPFYYRKAFEFIRDRPGDWLGCVAYKFRLLVNGYELPEVFDPYTAARYSPVLRMLVWKAGPLYFPYALLMPLAALGAWTGFRIRGPGFKPPAAQAGPIRRRNNRSAEADPTAGSAQAMLHLWLVLYVVSMLVSLLGYWNSSRYRLTIVPAMILWASAAAVWVWRRWRERSLASLASATGVMAVAALASLWPVEHFSKHYNFDAELHSLAGLERLNKERSAYDPTAGIEMLREAVALDPSSAAWEDNLGAALMNAGQIEEAIPHLERAVALEPNYYISWDNVGKAYGRRNRTDPAAAAQDAARSIAAYEKVLSLYPRSFPTLCNLGIAMMARGDVAVDHLQNAEARRDHDAALALFEKAIQIHPQLADAHNNIGVILRSRDQIPAAIEHFRKALEINPRQPQAKANLEAALGLRRPGSGPLLQGRIGG